MEIHLKGRGEQHKKIVRKILCVYESPGRFAKKPYIPGSYFQDYCDGGAPETELSKHLRMIRSGSEVYAEN